MSKKVIRVGSRDSVLAMWQTQFVIDRLQEVTDQYAFEIVSLKTKGDKILDVSLAKIGDKGLFTKELEVGLLQGQIDFAVHSMKDMPTVLP
ncbi:MAG: hydroxymethylbilane synthase, partial [Peptococcaceae bacterium]